jgi:alpha-maltose-1-phosphate synthase
MKHPSVLLSHPTGNQNVRNALISLVENGMLAEFWTTIAWDPNSRWNRILPRRWREQLARRSFPEVSKKQLWNIPWKEAIRLGVRSSPLRALLCSKERPFSVIGVYRHFDGKVARRLDAIRPDAVYAYEGGALQTFREAKKLGVRTIYELPSSYWHWDEKLYAEEAKENPEFAGLIPKLRDSNRHIEWKDEELCLADFVFVPSGHVRKTMSGAVPDEKIRLINYGAPALRQRAVDGRGSNGKLRVLFVGGLHQRKGISYLLDAVDRIGSQVELTLIGTRELSNKQIDEACRRWHWLGSLPHSQVLDRMLESDVLVLPSLSEGCALVVLEALACGLPVIITPNTGSLEFVSDGREGFVVPIRDSEAIAAKLGRLSYDRELLAEMSRNAQDTAAKKSWGSYRRDWSKAVREALCK